ncbi:MAG: hypothetical protein MMC33_006076 [Icmadophila ericetorum]|nr:hypothetical protein [Icmadophila ericetorum]
MISNDPFAPQRVAVQALEIHRQLSRDLEQQHRNESYAHGFVAIDGYVSENGDNRSDSEASEIPTEVYTVEGDRARDLEQGAVPLTEEEMGAFRAHQAQQEAETRANVRSYGKDDNALRRRVQLVREDRSVSLFKLIPPFVTSTVAHGVGAANPTLTDGSDPTVTDPSIAWVRSAIDDLISKFDSGNSHHGALILRPTPASFLRARNAKPQFETLWDAENETLIVKVWDKGVKFKKVRFEFVGADGKFGGDNFVEFVKGKKGGV